LRKSSLFNLREKIIKYNYFEQFFKYYIDTYIENMHEFEKEFYVDSRLIANKLGINLTSYKSTKVSIIIHDFGVPINFIEKYININTIINFVF